MKIEYCSKEKTSVIGGRGGCKRTQRRRWIVFEHHRPDGRPSDYTTAPSGARFKSAHSALVHNEGSAWTSGRSRTGCKLPDGEVRLPAAAWSGQTAAANIRLPTSRSAPA